jgi:hypothetical protein
VFHPTTNHSPDKKLFPSTSSYHQKEKHKLLLGGSNGRTSTVALLPLSEFKNSSESNILIHTS